MASHGMNAIQSFFAASVQRQRLPLTVAASASIAYVTYKAWSDYQAWLSVGPGGLPYNFRGWVIQVFTKVLKANHDMLSTAMYDDPAILSKYGGDTLGSRRFLSDADLPQRTPPRPHVYHFVAPQRQERPGSTTFIRNLQKEDFHRVVHENPELLEIKTSFLEKRGPAIFLAESVAAPAYSDMAKREIGHIHLEAEGSSHWTLSPADAKFVIERGWGQRHLLSGCVAILPHTYILLYAPRSEEEVRVHGNIIRASVAFMSGGKDVH